MTHYYFLVRPAIAISLLLFTALGQETKTRILPQKEGSFLVLQPDRKGNFTICADCKTIQDTSPGTPIPICVELRPCPGSSTKDYTVDFNDSHWKLSIKRITDGLGDKATWNVNVEGPATGTVFLRETPKHIPIALPREEDAQGHWKVPLHVEKESAEKGRMCWVEVPCKS